MVEPRGWGCVECLWLVGGGFNNWIVAASVRFYVLVPDWGIGIVGRELLGSFEWA